MTLAAEKELEHIGESSGCADHDHDLIHDLSKRLDALWRYDQYIANAEGKPELQKLWRDLKKQETDNIKRVKQIVAEEIRQKCF
jgi:protoheme ferro-lyase